MDWNKKIVRPAAAAALVCAVLAGCGASGRTQSAQTKAPGTARSAQELCAAECGQAQCIPLPVLLRAPQRDGTLMTLLSGNVLGGAFTTVSSCSTRNLVTEGTLTVQVCAVSQPEGQEASFALWKISDDASEYIKSISFCCDGVTRGYPFENLDSGAQYRVVFSCDDSRSRMSGTFAAQGVTQEAEEPQPESQPEE